MKTKLSHIYKAASLLLIVAILGGFSFAESESEYLDWYDLGGYVYVSEKDSMLEPDRDYVLSGEFEVVGTENVSGTVSVDLLFDGNKLNTALTVPIYRDGRYRVFKILNFSDILGKYVNIGIFSEGSIYEENLSFVDLKLVPSEDFSREDRLSATDVFGVSHNSSNIGGDSANRASVSTKGGSIATIRNEKAESSAQDASNAAVNSGNGTSINTQAAANAVASNSNSNEDVEYFAYDANGMLIGTRYASIERDPEGNVTSLVGMQTFTLDEINAYNWTRTDYDRTGRDQPILDFLAAVALGNISSPSISAEFAREKLREIIVCSYSDLPVDGCVDAVAAGFKTFYELLCFYDEKSPYYNPESLGSGLSYYDMAYFAFDLRGLSFNDYDRNTFVDEEGDSPRIDSLNFSLSIFSKEQLLTADLYYVYTPKDFEFDGTEDFSSAKLDMESGYWSRRDMTGWRGMTSHQVASLTAMKYMKLPALEFDGTENLAGKIFKDVDFSSCTGITGSLIASTQSVSSSNFKGINFDGTEDFSGTDLSWATFINCTGFTGAQLASAGSIKFFTYSGSIIAFNGNEDFAGKDLNNINLRNTSGLTVDQLMTAGSWYGVKLPALVFSGDEDFSGRVITNADLTLCTGLTGTQIAAADNDLSSLKLPAVIFDGTEDFTGKDLGYADFSLCSGITGAQLAAASDLDDLKLDSVIYFTGNENFAGKSLSGMDLSNAVGLTANVVMSSTGQLSFCKFPALEFNGTENFTNRRLYYSDFSLCTGITGAQIASAAKDTENCKFGEVVFSGDENLSGFQFRRSDISGFTGITYEMLARTDKNFESAKLPKVVFTGTESLLGFRLNSADFSRFVGLSPSSLLSANKDFSSSTLPEVIFDGTENLSGVRFNNADLTRVRGMTNDQIGQTSGVNYAKITQEQLDEWRPALKSKYARVYVDGVLVTP